MESVILHVDMNNFFASVSCMLHPELNGKPVAVCGDIEKRHGIILAKNNLAKQRGVKTGSTIGEARFFCPELCFLAPDIDRYLAYSRRAKAIYCDYTDRVESFGIDECWLDVTGSIRLFGDGVTIADEIRRRIREELGVTASVGVSYNKIFAKMGSDYQKPDATTLITQENFRALLWPLPVDDMLFAGSATRKKLHLYGIDTIGQLACSDFEQIVSLLGKCGAGLWQFANGLDRTPVSEEYRSPPIKSIGNGTTAPRDLVTDDEIRITMGHHIFLWRIEHATEGGSLIITRNSFESAPNGAAIYSIIAPEAEAQMAVYDNTYDTENPKLLCHVGGISYQDLYTYKLATGWEDEDDL